MLAWALRGVSSQALLSGANAPVILLESADGEPLARRGPFKEPDVAAKDFPKHLIDAVVSAEDQRFHSHWGIDPRGILRALSRNVAAGEIVEGGSTINQQLVKILHADRERSYKRKIREAALALWFDRSLGKDAILTRYLNTIYMGAGATGIPAAAKTYFDKQVKDLSLAESALLAGIIRAPTHLNPLLNPEAARARAAQVIDAMAANGLITKEQAKAAAMLPAPLDRGKNLAHAGSWFSDWVMEEAAEIAGPFGGTMRVRTTLVPQLQAIAEDTVATALAEAGAAGGVSEAALVALRPDGAVVAMVGGRSYEESEFNRAADALRQPGSTFKLFVYLAALRKGMTPEDRIKDEPIDVDGWKPENLDGRYRGRVSLAEAFARSLNAATVNLALQVGIPEVAAAARDMGIDAALAEAPSLALGTSEVSLLDLTGAYASVRAGVAPVEPWGIAGFGTSDQSRLFRPGPHVKAQKSLGPHHAPLMGLLKLVVDKGTGQAAALEGPAAGKTGTSQNNRDAWFVGFNEALVVGIWVGNDDNSPMNGVTGGSLPALIWKDFMTKAMNLARQQSADPMVTSSTARAVVEQAAAPSCNYRACARAYRSFRTSDCTFQPYRKRRKLCEK